MTFVESFQSLLAITARGWGGGVLPQKFGVGPASQNLYPIYNQICYILYPIYDLTKNSKPYLWPDPYFRRAFQLAP